MKNIDLLKKESNSMQYCRNMQKKFMDYIDRKLDMNNPKYHYHLFLMDDICIYPKFWFRINLLWYWKKYSWWYDLEDKLVLEWNDLKELFKKVLDFIENNKDKFLNPYYIW